MKLKKKFEQSLGELEALIMEVLWKLESGSVRDVLRVLRKKKKVAYTTVMTVMARLHSKGVLQRKMDKSGSYIYKPVCDRQSFLAKASKKIIRDFIKEYGEVGVASFVDMIDSADLKQARQWKKKLAKIR